MADEPIALVPGYRDLTVLGRGGSGVVYRGWQEAFDRFVAVKVLLGDFDEGAARRLAREGRLTARLTGHPHVVTVLDAGVTPAGQPYLVTELHECGSLQDRLAAVGPLAPAEVAGIGAKIAGALAEAHAVGVIHRDLKPSNILISRFGEPALADFGVAVAPETLSGMTAVHAFTPYHVAPETLSGALPSAAGDVYSLGSTLYQLLTGQPPFHRTDSDVASLLFRVLNEPAPAVDAPSVPGLAEVIGKALAKDPGERFGSAGEMAEALSGLIRAEAPTRPGVIAEPVAMAAPAPTIDPAAQAERDPSPVAPAPSPPWLTADRPSIPVTDDIATMSVAEPPGPTPADEEPRRRGKAVPIGAGATLLVVALAVASYVTRSGGPSTPPSTAPVAAGTPTGLGTTSFGGVAVPSASSIVASAMLRSSPASKPSTAPARAAAVTTSASGPSGFAGGIIPPPASSTMSPTGQPAPPPNPPTYVGCSDGHFCIYRNADGVGAVDTMGAFQSKNGDFGVAPWTTLNDHVYSVWNNSSSTFCVYYDAGYHGAFETIVPGTKGNLDPAFASNMSSLRILPPGGC